MRLHWLLCLGGILVSGCNNPDRNGLPVVDTHFDFGLLPDATSLDAGPPPQDLLPPDPLGPTISITAPKNKTLVTGSSLIVNATVTTIKGEPDISSVTLSASPGDPSMPAQSISMMREKTPGLFTGTLDLTMNPTGVMWVDVTAIDLAKRQNTATIDVTRDAGPVITVLSPSMSTYAGSAPVQFFVSDTFGIAPGPTGVTATVQGVAIPLKQQLNQNPPSWTGTIDFHSNLFMTQLTGLQAVHITAKNIKGTTSTLDVQFTVDETGPTILILKPMVGSIVGGLVTIEAQADDISGVADQSVIAVVEDFDEVKQMPFDRVVPLLNEGVGMASSNHYTGTFDTNALDPKFVYSNISVRAKDKLGNESNVSEQVILDNVAPSLDLDPPRTRVRKKTMMGIECSHIFDPVGDDAVNDGDVQNQEVWFRARADDQGNVAQGLKVSHPSGIDPNSIELYIIRAADAPLVVDTNNDMLCDDFNPKIAPTTNVMAPGQALKISLIPLPVGGLADFSSDMSTEFTNNGAMPPVPFCDSVGDMMSMPGMPLCNATTINYVMSAGTGMGTAIFVIAPITGDAFGCVGLQADLLNKIPDGPVCAAIRGKDLAGNRMVSRPIRLCLDKLNTGKVCDMSLYQTHKPGSVANNGLPDCTGTVDQNGVVNSTPCKPRVRLNTGGDPVPPFPIRSEPFMVQ